MNKDNENLNEAEKSALNIADANSGIFKPLCVGEIDELKDGIYKEQFFGYDETIDCEKVLDALQNLKGNPKLLDYVLKCLDEQKIVTTPNKFYAVIVNGENRMEYNEKIHGTFEKYKQFCVDGDFGVRKCDKLLDVTFDNYAEIEDYMMMDNAENIDGLGSTKFEKYTIHEIGA
jgi:hypothetical protein